MRVLPILFNTDMVQAILRKIDPKAATRRIIKGYIPDDAIWGYTAFTPKGYISCRGTFKVGYGEKFFKLPYRPDDILYVRETWAFLPCIECMNEGSGCSKTPATYEDKDSVSEGCFVYRAHHPRPEGVSWSPSIHMPKKAARIWLKVTDVRVERLQDIDGKGCITEGVEPEALKEVGEEFAKGMFHDIWDSTIKKSELNRYGWDANPRVWAIEFERCEKPEEEKCEGN